MQFQILISILCVILAISTSAAQTEPQDSFSAEGERWTVKPGALDSYDSESADQDLEIKSESGRTGYAQPAWVGEAPLDIGRLWIIQDENGAVIAECQRLSSGNDLQCMNTEGPAQSMYAD